MKICPKCKINQPLTNYWKRSSRSCGIRNRPGKGIQARCKTCMKQERFGYKNTKKGRNIINKLNKNYYYTEKGQETSKRKRLKDNGSKQRYAQSTFQRYYENGFVEKESCYICGENKSEAHHEDYNEPLDVLWLCKKHHQLRHKEIRNENNGMET